MRTTLKRLARIKARKHLPAMNGKSTYKIGKIYATSVKKVKRHPLISLSTAALALGALSGVVAWLRVRK